MRPPCPEALYGIHGDPNTVGKCPYCGYFLGYPRTGRDTRSISLDTEQWLDSRRSHVDHWGRVDVPEDQDPIRFYDGDD